jgi:arylsulfatase A-like enzyme
MKSALILFAALLSGTIAAGTKPNIIVIVTDDQGYADLSCQGSVADIRTPHLDALAASGVRCSAGYITSPQCSPSRAGLITGRYQARFGVEEIAQCPLPLEEKTIAEHLKPAGYRTAFVGKWHLDVNTLCADWLRKNLPADQLKKRGRGYLVPPRLHANFSPRSQGFDDYFAGEMIRYDTNFSLGGEARPEPEFITDKRFRVDVQSDAALAFIDKQKGSDLPFYLHLCYYAPHVPLEATEKYLDRFPGDMPERRRYGLAMISAVDDGVGRITAKLAEQGLTDNTLIVFISDNGAPLKGKKDLPIEKGGWDGSVNAPLSGEKGTLLEGGIRVPFLVSWPSVIPAGSVYSRPVISLDIAATARAAAGLPADPAIDGVDLVPHFLSRSNADPHPHLFWRFWGQTAVRSGDWKLLRLGNGTNEMLYHIGDDISEKDNLITQHPDRANALRRLLTDWESQMAPSKPRAKLNIQEKEFFKSRNPS